MKAKAMDLKMFQEYLLFNEATGIFTWSKDYNSYKAGDEAGTILNDGHLGLTINRRSYALHRVAWLFTHQGQPMPDMFYRVDGNKLNNRPDNLIPLSRTDHMRVITRKRVAERKMLAAMHRDNKK